MSGSPTTTSDAKADITIATGTHLEGKTRLPSTAASTDDRTRLQHVLVSTGACIIIAEFQKRELIKHLVAATGEGG